MSIDLKNYDDGYNYPDCVSRYGKKIVEVLNTANFFNEEPDVIPSILYKNFCDDGLKKWIDGDDMESPSDISENDFEKILSVSMAESVLIDLKVRGLVDSIEDENGVEMFFLTKLGRESCKNSSIMDLLDSEDASSETAKTY